MPPAGCRAIAIDAPFSWNFVAAALPQARAVEPQKSREQCTRHMSLLLSGLSSVLWCQLLLSDRPLWWDSCSTQWEHVKSESQHVNCVRC